MTMIAWNPSPHRLTGYSTLAFGSPRGGAPVSISWTEIGGVFLYTAANWPINAVFQLEAYLRATAGTVYAALYDLDDLSRPPASQVSTASSSFNRQRSSAVTLTDGHTYRLSVGTGAGAAGEILGSKIVVT